jgi:hypothetical protein
MSTQPIGYSGYGNAQVNLKKNLDSANLGKSGQNRHASAESGDWKSKIRDQINYYLNDVPKGDDGKLSFKDVDDYRAKLEKKWDKSVKSDLKKMGIDTDKKLPLSYNSASGKLTVSKQHPDKALIDKYFASNPDKVEEFKTIIQLGKMTSASRSKLSSVELHKNLQQQALAWWYGENSDPTTWFKGGGMMLGQGKSSYTGLDIKV